MPIPEKTAVLVISFGTSYPETRKKTIEKTIAFLERQVKDLEEELQIWHKVSIGNHCL